MKSFRSLLFVPGSRPDRYAKALASGADAICIDLEDAVPPKDKAEARATVIAWLNQSHATNCAIGIRINGLSTADGFRDVAAFSETKGRSNYFMVPKAESASSLANMREALGLETKGDDAVALWAVIESVQGLLNAQEIGGALGPSGGMLFGGADYSAMLGTTMDWEPLFHARSTLAAIAKLTGSTLMDVPFLDVSDVAGLQAESLRVQALGFNGKACIHPSQVAVVNDVFSPDLVEIEWAKRVIAAFNTHQGNAVLLDGKLLDTPIYQRAERILATIAH